MMMNPIDHWWKSAKGKVHETLFRQVSQYERDQIERYDRWAELEAHYNPQITGYDGIPKRNQMRRNFIATNVDTVHAMLTQAGIRPRLLTNDGDWKTQRRATHLSWYAEDLDKDQKNAEVCADAAKIGALKGTGLIKVSIDPWKRIVTEAVNIDDIVLSPSEAACGKVRQLHHAIIGNVDELIAAYPRMRDQIDMARGQDVLQDRWASWRKLDETQVALWDSYTLPIGTVGDKRYVPGRHAMCGEGFDLVDEEWSDPWFPFAEFRWSRAPRGYFGIGLAERIEGIQRSADKFVHQIEMTLDHSAFPTSYVAWNDMGAVANMTRSRVGSVVPTKSGQPPVTVTPPSVHPEIYRREGYLEEASMRDSGVSQMAAQGVRPAGVPGSGVGLREYKDQTSVRMAPQEHGFESLRLQTVWLQLAACKKLGKDAPVITRISLHGPRHFSWADVDMRETKVQLVAASSMSQVPAGRAQFVTEMAQGGVISQEVARKLLMPHSPMDIEHEMSLYSAALKSAETHIQDILDGGEAYPTKFQNAKLNVWRGTAEYDLVESAGAPEEILDRLDTWIMQSAWIVSQSQKSEMAGMAQQAAPDAAMTGAGVLPAQLIG